MIAYSEKPLSPDFIAHRRDVFMSATSSLWRENKVPQIVVIRGTETRGIPPELWNGDSILLNIGSKQIAGYNAGIEFLEFNTRFNGKSHRVIIPYTNILEIRERDGLFSTVIPCIIYDPLKFQENMKIHLEQQMTMNLTKEEADELNFDLSIDEEEAPLVSDSSLQLLEGVDTENMSPVDPKQINLRHKTELNGGRPKLTSV